MGPPTLRRLIVLALVWMAAPAVVHANLLADINAARAKGCGGRPGTARTVSSSETLVDLARRVQRGEALRDAMHAVSYRPIKSTSIHMSGWLTDAAIVRNLTRTFCTALVDPDLREVGIYRQGNGLWMIMAQPLNVPRDAVAADMRILALTNQARAEPRTCGSDYFAAAGPLTWSQALHQAALLHSRDMARRNYLEHRSPDGSQPGERATSQGYRWRVVGENLAGGTVTPEETVKGWLKSPHHCANLMDPRFTQMGVAYAVDESSDMAIYWTQLFAVPR